MGTIPGRIAPWRQLFQTVSTLALLGIPFIRIDGESLLRIDLQTLTLRAFGYLYRIEDLHLLLLLALALVLLFLLVTLAFGRVWCGWACPQTTLSDLTEGFARLIGMQSSGGCLAGNLWQKSLLQLFCLALTLLVAANLVWYFVSPYDFFRRLMAGDPGRDLLIVLGVTACAVYLDLLFLRRLFCREFCPYGRFQTALVDPGTLTLRFQEEEGASCIRCGACIRSCPVGIDIRRGYQVECINCGRCRDACREVMTRRGEPGLIRYTFGLDGKGVKALVNLRIGLLLIAFIIFVIGIVLATVHLPEATLELARTAAPFRPLPDGRVVHFFSAYLNNRGEEAGTFTLRAEGVDGSPLEIQGPATKADLAAGERRRLDFALIAPKPSPDRGLGALLLLCDSRGRVVARAEALVITAQE